MLRPEEEVRFTPRQEVVQGGFGRRVHVDVVSVGPDLQTHQHDANVQSPVELRAEVRRELKINLPLKAENVVTLSM